VAEVAKTENIVALCDVDKKYAAKTFKQYPKAEKYTDYRRMLDDMGDSLNGVVIATPDHTHAVTTKAALDRGLHVYCEKPLTHNVWEARQIAKAAREADVTTQLGIQGHSTEGARRLVEWVRAGVIGEVKKIEAWCDQTYYPPGKQVWNPSIRHAPKKGMKVPATLDWDLWIGPAEMRPYHEVYHPRAWRAWWDFGTGWMCDRGVHTFDPFVWAADLHNPERVSARASFGRTKELHPLACMVNFEFPSRGDRGPVDVTWYTGMRPPRPRELKPGQQLGDARGGTLITGTKGKLTCGIYGGDPRLLPLSRMKEFAANQPPKTLPRVKTSHQQNWVQACKKGEKASADFQYGARVSEICLLGNVAKRVNTSFRWDAEKMKATNLPEANKWVKPEYRDGWSL
jgi:predicted dehydrogenase